ncbi:MAG: metalloregulator ArsR/SmtB family transcription factor [Thiogranum sp.]|jgi:ArsR family transcriptional regulator|nr:metalloregulator ArsR/SmtB family transcription factor [Thiogranum sp.]
MEPESYFKALADLTRLRILRLLILEGELCVCELTHALGEIQPKISRHLALLKEVALVLDERRGQWVYYRLNPALPGWVGEVLAAAAQGLGAHKRFAADHRALKAMPDRPGGVRCA